MGGIFLKIVKAGDGGCFEILFLSDEGLADSVIFDIIPNELIGVEFRTVGGQKEQAQFLLNCFQESLDFFGSVRGMGIDDQKDFFATTMKKAPQELQKDGSVHRFFRDHESNISSRGDRRNHVEPESLTGRSDHGGFTLDAPCGPGMKIRTHSRFILEEDLSPFPLRLDANPGIFLLEPLLNQRGILLQSFDQRFLAGEAQLGQEPSDRGKRKADPVFFPKKRPHHSPSPKGEGKLQLKGILGGDRLVEPAHLGSGNLFGSASNSPCSQAIPTSSTISGQPLIDATTGKSQGLDDGLGALPVLNLLNGTDTDSLTGLVIDPAAIALRNSRLLCGHAFAYHNLNLMYSEL